MGRGGLGVNNAAHEEFRIHDFTPAPESLFQVLLLESKPVSNPPHTVTNIKNQKCMFGVDASLLPHAHWHATRIGCLCNLNGQLAQVRQVRR